MALETFVEDSDPLAPELLRTCHETIKMGADNPDNHYRNALINGTYDYRITGRRGTVHYLGFGTQEGNYGATGSLPTGGYLDDSNIRFEPDGRFEIVVSAEPSPGQRRRASGRRAAAAHGGQYPVGCGVELDRSGERTAALGAEREDASRRCVSMSASAPQGPAFGFSTRHTFPSAVFAQ